MKFVMQSDRWVWTTKPFPGFRCTLGEKGPVAALHVKDVHPVTIVTVTSPVIVATGEYTGISRPLYVGTDFSKAKQIRDDYNAEQSAKGNRIRAKISVSDPVLPEGRFQVVTTDKKGNHIVVSGKDETNSCLLFIGIEGSLHDRTSVHYEGTTGSIITTCQVLYDDHHLYSYTEAVVVLDVGQDIVFRLDSCDRERDGVLLYRWTGQHIWDQHYTHRAWAARNDPPHDDGDGFEG